MANIEEALKHVIDLVSHFVKTNTRWNQDLGEVEAAAKVDAAKVAMASEDVSKVAGDVAAKDDAAAVVDGIQAVTDLSKGETK